MTRCLTIVGAIWVGLHGFIWIAKATKVYWGRNSPAASYPSPDQRYKAVVFLSVGGGPASSYCGTSVYAVTMETADADIEESQNPVYAASCGGMAEGHWSKNIRWKSGSELEIAFDPTAAASGSWADARIKGYAAEGRIHVSYVFLAGGDSW